MRSHKGKIRLDIGKLEAKQAKDMRRLDMLKRQIVMTRNIIDMLNNSLKKEAEKVPEWKPSEIPTPDIGVVSDIPASEATPLEGK